MSVEFDGDETSLILYLMKLSRSISLIRQQNLMHETLYETPLRLT
jgi:hypothetical protein